jgi:hypothetical protein
MTRGLGPLLGASLLLSVACGGRSVDASRTGNRSDAGAGGAPTESCRLFAARFQRSDQTEVSDCSFERASLTLSCVLPDRVVSTAWDTIDDAIADNRPVGRITLSTRSFDSTEARFTESVGYDDSGQPLFMNATAESKDPNSTASYGHESATYFGWDGAGRPIEAVLALVWSAPIRQGFHCDGQRQTYEYDDANHRVVTTRSGGEGLNCRAYTTTTTYDDAGLLVSETYEFEDPRPPVQVVEYATFEAREICRD